MPESLGIDSLSVPEAVLAILSTKSARPGLKIVENQGLCALWSTFKWGCNFQSFKEAGAFLEKHNNKASFQQKLAIDRYNSKL